MNTEETTTTQPGASSPERPESNQVPSGAQPSQAAESANLSPSAPGAAAEPPPATEAAEPPPPAAATPPPAAAEHEDNDPPPPAAARRAEQWDEEQPGDNIGNRLPGASLPDDIGNRRRGGSNAGHRAGGGPGEKRQHAPAPSHGAAPAVAPEAGAGAGAGTTPVEGEGGEGAKKRKRRRRRKGAAPGAEGAAVTAEGAVEGAEHEGEEAEVEGEEGEHTGDEGHPEDGADGETAEGGERRKRRRGPPPSALRDRPAFSIGEEVFGKVSKVTDAAVWIDIAGKATGLFDRREIMEEEAPVEGDQFIATVASTGVRGGMLMLSRLPLNLEETRKALEAASTSGEAVAGFVTGAVKGGLEVDLGGLRAFAPASHVDLHHGADLNYLVGQHLDFIVTQYAKKGRDVVVSRRKMLDEESKKVRAEAVSKIEPGSIHQGVVRKVVAWGAFIALPDVGNIEGLVHMTEASHDRGARLVDIFKQGAEIEVKVLRIDEKGKLWLSRKAVTTDPWDLVKDKYAPGTRHKGKVARLQPFGAFIELESGIDGLIHTADLSLKTIEHPEEVVKVGDELEVIVAACDPGGRRIGLHPAPPPGEEAEPRQRLAPHKIVKVAIVQSIEGGLVVRVLGVTGRAARGFIPAGHTGTPRGSDLRKEFPVGTQLDAKVLEIDPRRGEAKLSIRAVKEDAEKQAYSQYRAGVAREAKFGTFADLMKKVT